MNTNTNISIEALKRHAKRLQKEIRKNNPAFKLSEAQELLAKTFGLNNWHEMHETAKKNEKINEIEKNYLWYCENSSSFSVKDLLKEHPEINVDIEQGLRRSVKSGKLRTVINFLEEYSPKNSEMQWTQDILLGTYYSACTIGRLDVVQYFDHYFEKYGMIQNNYRVSGLYYAYTEGHFKVVQYFLEASHIKDSVNHQKIINEVFLSAVFNHNMMGVFGHQHIEVMQYLLTSQKIPFRANINTDNSKALENSALQKDTMQYLLSSPELKEHGDIYAKNGEVFEYIYMIGHKSEYYEVVDYIINEYKIEKTPQIIKVLEKYHKQRTIPTIPVVYYNFMNKY